MKVHRLRVVAAALAALLWLSGGGEGRAAAPGTIIITDRRVEPGAETFEKEVKAAQKTVLERNKGEDWHLHFVAWLKKPAGAQRLNIVFYPLPETRHEPVHFYEISTKPAAKIVMSEVTLSEGDGFKPGGRYQVLITRLVAGREDIYARTVLELK